MAGLLAGAAALCTLGGSLQAQPAAERADGDGARPNFVVIFADDLGYGDLSCSGSQTIKTPNLDRMAREGARLTDFYVASPTCTPSRAALLTGRLGIRTGLNRVLFPHDDVGLTDSETTIADILQDAGYATGCIGKWHLGHLPQFLPTRHGFDYYYGLPYSNDMGKEEQGHPPVPLMRNERIIEQPVDQETLTQRYTEQACGFIRRHAKESFFLYVPHTMPHIPLFASERFRGKSEGGLYGDVVEEIDWSTGEILNTLRKEGLAENTLVIFTSDNGPWLQVLPDAGSSGGLRDGKFTLYEGGVRMPCVAWWPGTIEAGQVIGKPASTLDLLPTFARLAGAEAPDDRVLDGADMAPLLLGTGEREGDILFAHQGRLAIRSGKWKLILPANPKEGTPELFDLEADTHEQENLAAEHPDVLRRLESRLEEHRKKKDGEAGY